MGRQLPAPFGFSATGKGPLASIGFAGDNRVSAACDVRVRFRPPPEPLRRYFTTFYLVEVDVPDGGLIDDCLHPEWGNLRLHQGATPSARTKGGSTLAGSTFAVTGPTSQSVDFSIGTTRMWGIGLLPLGWARFVGAPASDYADRLVDGHADPAFAPFAPLARSVYGPQRDPDGEFRRIADHFLGRLDENVPDETRIVALHTALVDPEARDVADLCERTGLAQRTLERLSRRHFGFPPKLLLRRQRFLRSLAQFMLNPGQKWIKAMDGQYHDQAQFVRDFRQFMGIAPRQYAARPKPVLGAIAVERARFAGHAVQALDGPGGAPVRA